MPEQLTYGVYVNAEVKHEKRNARRSMPLRHGVSASLLSSSIVRYLRVVSVSLILPTAAAGDLLMMPCATVLLSTAMSLAKYNLAEFGDID